MEIKKIDSWHSDEQLADMLREDLLGRNEEVASLARIVGDIPDGSSVFIDAPWGEGKTVLVRQLKMVIEAAVEGMDPGVDIDSVMASRCFEAVSFDAPILPIYYNA